MRLRSLLLSGALLVVLASATTLAVASRRIDAEQAAYSTPSAGRCTPTTLNRSAVLPGTGLAVSPLPDSYDASTQTQISLLGAAPGAIGAVHVSGSQTGTHAGRLLAYSQGDGASFVPAQGVPAGRDRDRARQRQGRRQRQPFAYHFVVAHQDPVDYAAAVTAPHGLHRDAALPLAPGTRTTRAGRDAPAPPRQPPAICSPRPTAAPAPAGR